MRRTIIGGFTLLEVMVAVAIMALSLTAIFSSQGGAIRAGARARHLTTATLLARCKMGEVEEQMAREGFPAVMADGDDECCEDGEQEGFRCHWQVEQVMLPDSMSENDNPLGLGLGGEGTGSTPGRSGADATASNLEQALTGAAGGDMIGSFALQYTYPILRPMIEQQVRRATVSVRWREGGGRGPELSGPCQEDERTCFTVVQYLVADQGIAVPGQNGTTPPGTPPGNTPPGTPPGNQGPVPPGNLRP
jgi:general secretion pathway protein I